MSLDMLPFGASFALLIGCVLFYFVSNMIRHGGIKGAVFGARIRRTVGEVRGAGRSWFKTIVRVHVLDGAPQKVIGLELVATSFASYQMMPFSMSMAEARQLIAHLEEATSTASGGRHASAGRH